MKLTILFIGECDEMGSMPTCDEYDSVDEILLEYLPDNMMDADRVVVFSQTEDGQLNPETETMTIEDACEIVDIEYDD